MKLKQVTLIALLAVAPLAHADLLGAGSKWTAFFPTESTNSESPELDNGDTNLGLELYFEHSVPFIPNVQAEFVEIKSQDFKYLSSSATAYYKVLDRDVVGLDLGVGLTSLRTGEIGDYNNSIGGGGSTEFDGMGGHIYVAGEFAVPTMQGLALIASAKKSASSELKGHDIKLGAQYTHSVTKFNWVLQGGYRDVSHEVDVQKVDYRFDTSGFFASVGIDF